MEVFGGTHGIIMTFIIGLIVGIVGSFVATWLGQAMHWYAPGQSAGFIGSVIGAIILLLIYHLVRRKTA